MRFSRLFAVRLVLHHPVLVLEELEALGLEELEALGLLELRNLKESSTDQ